MLKIIPLSAAILLCVSCAYAQNGSNGTTTTTPDTTDSSDSNSLYTTPDTGTVTPTTTGTDGSSITGPVTTPVNTTTTPVTTTTPNTITTTPVTTTPSTITNTAPTTSSSTTSTTTTTTTSPVNSFSCAGVTPAWNLSVSKNLITYASTKDPNAKLRGVIATVPMGDTTGNLQAFTTKDSNNKNVTILINRNASGCVNGQPGQSYNYDAFIVFPHQVLVGCCNSQ